MGKSQIYTSKGAVIINWYQGVEESRGGGEFECKHFEGGAKFECKDFEGGKI